MKKSNKSQIKEAYHLMGSGENDAFVDDLESSINRAIEKAKEHQSAVVESVVLLSPSEKKQVEKTLLSILERNVKIIYSQTPSLLGGIRITVGDFILDASLLYQIEKMKNIFGGTL